MGEERIPQRLSPADFGVPPDDEWVEPADDLVDFLKDDPEVDWTNMWVRRGARDEMAGRPRDQNPYASKDAPSLTRDDWRGWRDGWMASGNFHGRFDRPAFRAWQARGREWLHIQHMIDFGIYRKRGEGEPLNPFPEAPDFIIRKTANP